MYNTIFSTLRISLFHKDCKSLRYKQILHIYHFYKHETIYIKLSGKSISKTLYSESNSSESLYMQELWISKFAHTIAPSVPPVLMMQHFLKELKATGTQDSNDIKLTNFWLLFQEKSITCFTAFLPTMTISISCVDSQLAPALHSGLLL